MNKLDVDIMNKEFMALGLEFTKEVREILRRRIEEAGIHNEKSVDKETAMRIVASYSALISSIIAEFHLYNKKASLTFCNLLIKDFEDDHK